MTDLEKLPLVAIAASQIGIDEAWAIVDKLTDEELVDPQAASKLAFRRALDQAWHLNDEGELLI